MVGNNQLGLPGYIAYSSAAERANKSKVRRGNDCLSRHERGHSLADGRQRPGSRERIRLIERADLLISPMVLLELELLTKSADKALGSRIQSKIEHELMFMFVNFPSSQVVQAARDENDATHFDRLIVAHAKINGLARFFRRTSKLRGIMRGPCGEALRR